MKITLTADRKITKIEGYDFHITLNGKTNAEYSKILAALGVELIWVEVSLKSGDIIDNKYFKPPAHANKIS